MSGAEQTFVYPDGYETCLRRWGPPSASDVVIATHGFVTHSGVFDRLGRALMKHRGLALVALDRRGSGRRNHEHGDPRGADVSADIVCAARAQLREGSRVHLLAWCGSFLDGVLAVDSAPEVFATVTYMTPRIDKSVDTELARTKLAEMLRRAEAAFDDETPVPTPDWLSVFVDPPDVEEVRKDPRILRTVTRASWRGNAERRQRATQVVRTLVPPQAALFGVRDAIVDAGRSRKLAAEWIPGDRLFDVDGPHAVWYSRPDEVARIVSDLIGGT